MLSRLKARLLCGVGIALASVIVGTACFAQTLALTANDYARAEKFMGYNSNPLVFGAGIRPRWLPGDRFWYRVTSAKGSEFLLVDPRRGTRGPAFDQAKLATALSMASGTAYDAFHLPFTQFDFSNDGGTITFNVGNRRFACDFEANRCAASRGPEPSSALSPDGKRSAFIRDYNLWVREVAGGKETQLTTGGVKDFGYATDNAGWIKSDRPVLLWSPDSKKIATFQHDSRGTGEMYLVDTRVGHPKLEAWKYPLPGDDKIFMIERIIIDVDRARVTRLQMPADAHRSSVCDHVQCGDGQLADAEWSRDSVQLAFVSTSRDHKRAQLRVADASTGKVRDVLEERVDTFFESGSDRFNWRVLPASMVTRTALRKLLTSACSIKSKNAENHGVMGGLEYVALEDLARLEEVRGEPVHGPEVDQDVEVAEHVRAAEGDQRPGGRDRKGDEEEGGQRLAAERVLVSQVPMFAAA